MLPGFRLLLTSVLLAASVLVFGLGAAALLRATHEEFAAIPALRNLQTPASPVVAEVPLPPPTIALLRVEPPVMASEDSAAETPPADATQAEPPLSEPASSPHEQAQAPADQQLTPDAASNPAAVAPSSEPAQALAPIVVARTDPAAPVTQASPSPSAVTPGRELRRGRLHKRAKVIRRRRIIVHRIRRPPPPPPLPTPPETTFFPLFEQNPQNQIYQTQTTTPTNRPRS